jgi:hypothetical protein|uniref:ATP synthase F0 subunit 8 n=1 Tax=Ochromonas danica TaxID=2986 RepID=Q9G8Z1_OCHDN|nr:ATP synthase F0 subunit 8 [Ochromonas danica]AAG18415.1 ATP synthase F0 subunit 8 [Ochromonas danica]
MPQFDIFAFYPIVFWLTISLLAFYLFFTKSFVVNAARVLKLRSQLNELSSFFAVDLYSSLIKRSI